MSSNKKLCLFAHYNAADIISEYVFSYINSLTKIEFNIIFISNSLIDGINKQKLLDVNSSIQIYERENRGNDFGAWAWYLTKHGVSENVDYLLLANDSVFGPLFDLQPIFSKMQAKEELDFWGLTDTYQGAWHIQSYFICFNRKTFQSEAFQSVFKNNFNNKTKAEIIEQGEIFLTQNLIKSGFKAEAFVPFKGLDRNVNPLFAYNPTHFFWDVLIKKFGFPFIKKELLFKNPDNLQSVENVFQIIRQQSNYNTAYIKDAIVEANQRIDCITSLPSVSILCHVYYPQSVYYFFSLLSVLKKYKAKFFFNLADTIAVDPDIVDVLQRIFPDAIIIETPDKGRDIGGKMCLLDILLKMEIESKYTLIIHDKFSPHTQTGNQWRDELFKIIDINNVNAIFDLFEEKSSIGIIAAKKLIKNEFNPESKGFNCTSSTILLDLIDEYKLQITDFNFVAGTIFWIRTEILKSFFGENLPIEVREKLEDGNAVDFEKGTFIHAWERLLSMLANAYHYKIKGI